MSKFIQNFIAVIVSSVAILAASAVIAHAQVLKSDPPAGTLAAGHKVLVDDGSCPTGQIKEVTGALDRHSYRVIRCIKKK
jgi:hypothetical protein